MPFLKKLTSLALHLRSRLHIRIQPAYGIFILKSLAGFFWEMCWYGKIWKVCELHSWRSLKPGADDLGPSRCGLTPVPIIPHHPLLARGDGCWSLQHLARRQIWSRRPVILNLVLPVAVNALWKRHRPNKDYVNHIRNLAVCEEWFPVGGSLSAC